MTDDAIAVRFGAETAGLEAGVDRAKSKLGEVHGEVEHLEEMFKYLGERMVEVFALHEIAEFVSKMSELGEQALRSAAMLGMTVEQVQELAYAAKLAGTDSEAFQQSMVRFERNIADAEKGSGKAAEAFHNLGISQQELKNSSPEQLLYKVADAFAGTADGAEKVQYAIALGGRSWAQMIPMLDKGSDALKRAGEEAKATASVMTTEQAEALEKTHQGLVQMEASWRGVGLAIMGVAGPAIDDVIAALSAAAKVIVDIISILRQLQLEFSVDLVLAVGQYIAAVRDLGSVTEMIVAKAMARWRELGATMTAVATGQWSLLKDIYAEADAQSEAAGKKNLANLAANAAGYEDLRAHALKAMHDIQAKQKELEKAGDAKPQLAPLAGGFGKKDNTERQLAEEDVRFQEQMGKLEIANRKTILDEKVALGEISKKQEYAQLQQLLDQEHELEVQALVDESQIAGLSVVEKRKINDQLLLLDQKYQNDKAALDRKALDDQKKQYDQFFQGINHAFTTSINGLIQGTKTWQQAIASIFTDILASFADMAEKMVSKWLESMLMTAVFGKTEGATQIGTSAAEAGAAAFASTAAIPVIGPELAPAAASAAYASTMAFQGLLPLETGAWDIPTTGPALLHPGEMVVPQTFAQSLRDNGGFGGGNVNITVSAIDTQTGAQFLKNNARAIAQAVSAQIRSFNPATPAWKS